MIQRLYDWMMAVSQTKYGMWLVAVVSFAESSFFPIPPDMMLVPMMLGNRARIWVYALVCTIASVAGGVLGYFIGMWLYDSVGMWLVQLYGAADKMEHMRDLYRQWGDWVILIKGFTPFPYKFVTIASGMAGYSLPMFILLSAVTRGARFFLIAWLLWMYGEQAKTFIEKRLTSILLITLAILVVGFVGLKWLM